MRIAFIIPDKEMRWDSVHQGVGYVAAYLNRHFPVSECRVLRTYGLSEDEQLEFLRQDWDVVGLTLTTPAVKEAVWLCQKVKELGNAKIVLGGAEVTTVEEDILTQIPDADFAVIGEGEITFCELMKSLAGECDISTVKGLAYRNSDGEIKQNTIREFEKDLDQFPHPDRTLFEYDYDFHSMIGTRGCPYHCTFCNSSSNWRHQYRVRSPEAVYDEVKYIVDLYGREKYFAFNDDAFNIKKQWVIDVCALLKKLGVKWWIRGLRAGLVTEEVADSLAGSGCMGGAVGVESADNEALKTMRKATNIEEILKGVEIMVSRGLDVTGQFIIGNHGDTLETVKKSLAIAHCFFRATFGIAYPIPHTYLYDYVMKNDLLLKERIPIEHNGKIIDWVLFDTPQFTVEERFEAVRLAIEAKVYHGIDYDADE